MKNIVRMFKYLGAAIISYVIIFNNDIYIKGVAVPSLFVFGYLIGLEDGRD